MTDALALSLERILRPCKYSVRQDGLDSFQQALSPHPRGIYTRIFGRDAQALQWRETLSVFQQNPGVNHIC